MRINYSEGYRARDSTAIIIIFVVVVVVVVLVLANYSQSKYNRNYSPTEYSRYHAVNVLKT